MLFSVESNRISRGKVGRIFIFMVVTNFFVASEMWYRTLPLITNMRDPSVFTMSGSSTPKTWLFVPEKSTPSVEVSGWAVRAVDCML